MALLKLMYLVHNNIREKWTMPLANWGQTAQKLAIWFPGRKNEVRFELKIEGIFPGPRGRERSLDTVYFTDLSEIRIYTSTLCSIPSSISVIASPLPCLSSIFHQELSLLFN